jgi:hypothetical protein
VYLCEGAGVGAHAAQVYKPGSTAAAAQLLDARDLFDAGSARSDKLLRQLTGQLDEAVIACATAAGAGGAVRRVLPTIAHPESLLLEAAAKLNSCDQVVQYLC